MIIKNKARVNAFYLNYLPPRFLSRKTHGVSLYAKLAKISLTSTRQNMKSELLHVSAIFEGLK